MPAKKINQRSTNVETPGRTDERTQKYGDRADGWPTSGWQRLRWKPRSERWDGRRTREFKRNIGRQGDGRTSPEASAGTAGWLDFERFLQTSLKIFWTRIPWRPPWVRVGSSAAYKPRAWEAQRRPSAGFGRLPGSSAAAEGWTNPVHVGRGQQPSHGVLF